MWMKKCLLTLALVLLVGCQDNKRETPESYNDDQKKTLKDNDDSSLTRVAESHIEYKQQYQVADEMKDFPIYEIGELIVNLMTDEDQLIFGWEHLQDDKHIKWLTSEYQEELNSQNNTTFTSREGLVRVHIQGNRVGHYQAENIESPWLINYLGREAKLGVQSVEIAPVGDFQNFPDPLASLKQHRVAYKTLCESTAGEEHTAVYALTAPKKQPIYLFDQSSAGSAGSSRWLTLYVQNPEKTWCVKNE